MTPKQKLKLADRLYCGGYVIQRCDDGQFWLSKADGEGMQTSEEKLKKMLDEFWAKEF